MQVIADLQLHSKYSRAVSPQMTIPFISGWAKRKGIGLIATGDWTHPLWMREIKNNLEEVGNGFLRLKPQQEKQFTEGEDPYFLLATEVSSIYSQGGKGRRIHNLIWSPSIITAEKIIQELQRRGANLMSDGRPIIGLSSIQVAELVFSIDPSCLLIPAHAWTPWFSLYGSESGFDTIEECFGAYSKYIYAIETGLSSDPSMNWRIPDLDHRSILSFSDAHSGPKLGREATVFEFGGQVSDFSYQKLREAITQQSVVSSQNSVISNQKSEISTENRSPTTDNRIAYTIEFYPEEGKYHYTGHRSCNVKQMPEETKKKGILCPVCGRKLTVGVMHRVEDLAGMSEADVQLVKRLIPDTQIEGTYSETYPKRPPYIKFVPLQEIIAEVVHAAVTTQKVQSEYTKLTDSLGSEFQILLKSSIPDIARISGPMIAEAVEKVRKGDIFVDPGYDGVFGVVKIEGKTQENTKQATKDQLTLF